MQLLSKWPAVASFKVTESDFDLIGSTTLILHKNKTSRVIPPHTITKQIYNKGVFITHFIRF